MINRNQLTVANGDVLVHEKNMYVMMYEMMHGFGFSSTYKYFVDANGKTLTGHIKTAIIAGYNRTVLDVAPLTQKLRDFYGCSALPGAILENGGGSTTDASHFERKYFVYEYMSSGSIYGRRVSEFSLALLEGSGWYVPDYNYSEPFFYGQGQGCSFISSPAAPQLPNLMNTVLEAAEDVLHMVWVVVPVQVTLLWMGADSSGLLKIITASSKMELIMLDFPLCKYSEEMLVASASLVLSIPDHPIV